MKRTEFKQINTPAHWDEGHLKTTYPFPGLDYYLLLINFYRDFLINLKFGDILSPGTNWLDFGCGNAALRNPLLNLPESIKYYGIDFSDKVIKKNRRLLKNNKQAEFSSNLPTAGEFNLITSIHTFEHLDDPEKTFDLLWERTKNYLIIQVPYKKSMLCKQHLWLFDEDSFKTKNPPIMILSPALNNDDDHEIAYIWSKKHGNSQRQFFKPYQNTRSPQGWFLWHAKLGLIKFYYPLWRFILEKLLPLKFIFKLKSFYKNIIDYKKY